MNKRIAIVGVGSIGSRHIDNLLAMGYTDLVGVDTRPMPHEERLPIISAFCDLEPWQPTHALICSPPEWHYHHAKYFVERGIPTFIEKPMATKAIEADALNELAKAAGTYIAVGYMERAHPAVKAAKEYIKTYDCYKADISCYWRSSRKTYDLDLAMESSHAIDTACFLLGPAKVESQTKRLDELTVVLHHDRGSVSTVRMNMHEWPRRVINLSSRNNTYSIYGDSKEEWDECYKAELQAFLDGKPLCTGEDGLAVMNILEQLT